MIDDNIKALEKRDELLQEKYHKLVKLNENFNKVFEDLIITMDKKGYAQLGISFSGSNWCVQEETKDKTRIWAVFGIDLNKIGNINFDDKCLLCQDFDFTIQLIKGGLKTGVYYKYAFDKVMAERKGGGNVSLYDNIKRTKEVTEYIERKHGTSICNSVFNGKHNKYEISVNWKNINPTLNHSFW
jgi:hypothetical protein